MAYVKESPEYVNEFPSSEREFTSRKFEQIIGNSPALDFVLAEVERVAPTDSTVLIQGETGTGKELIARAVHNISLRCGRPFLKLNCAAIPFDLLESELFGHEKGAFTGAIAQKQGRFELADTGTLFLDEIGDLPLGLQPKLLRVLQDQEFERLGSSRTHHVSVRMVAATHCDLAEMVRKNEFRSDLYYRLNVFPITVPPLRERQQDIPELVLHFVEVFARRMGKRIENIPQETLAGLSSYSWPGNVRELQNLIERAVIRSNNGTLPNPLSAFDGRSCCRSMPSRGGSVVSALDLVPAGASKAEMPSPETLKESERLLILRTLEETGWVNGGVDGAARRLGLKRTTLIAKMKKLGIVRPPRQSDVEGTDDRWTRQQNWPAAE